MLSCLGCCLMGHWCWIFSVQALAFGVQALAALWHGKANGTGIYVIAKGHQLLKATRCLATQWHLLMLNQNTTVLCSMRCKEIWAKEIDWRFSCPLKDKVWSLSFGWKQRSLKVCPSFLQSAASFSLVCKWADVSSILSSWDTDVKDCPGNFLLLGKHEIQLLVPWSWCLSNYVSAQ